ncbi:hypothetical protein GQ457_14G013490 [Hibiscus cannabinus]
MCASFPSKDFTSTVPEYMQGEVKEYDVGNLRLARLKLGSSYAARFSSMKLTHLQLAHFSSFQLPLDFDLWEIIEEGFVEGPKKKKNRSSKDMGKAKLNAKAMHTLLCGLNDDVSKNVSSCKSAKEMWEKLEKLYKKEEMKCAKYNLSSHIPAAKQASPPFSKPSLVCRLSKMRIEKCWFCSSTVYPGHGIQFVRNDAKIFRFCRSKCHKNFKMKRNPRKVKWTKAYRRLHGKDMTQDSTFEFERKRNRPERYDRNLAENTLKAIKKIDKIRSDRASDHIKNRLKTGKVQRQKEARKQLEQGIHLVKAPLALAQDSSLHLPKIKVNVSQAQTEGNQPMEE